MEHDGAGKVANFTKIEDNHCQEASIKDSISKGHWVLNEFTQRCPNMVGTLPQPTKCTSAGEKKWEMDHGRADACTIQITSMNVRMSLDLCVSSVVYMSNYTSIHVLVNLFICCTRLFICLSFYLSIYRSVYPFVNLSYPSLKMCAHTVRHACSWVGWCDVWYLHFSSPKSWWTSFV